MNIEAFLAARVEEVFALYGALIQIDGVTTWTAADVVGRTPQFQVQQAQDYGLVEITKRLRALREQYPDASLGLFTDSKPLVDQLIGQWPRAHNPRRELERAVRSLRLQVSYRRRSENLGAHDLITQLCQKHRVPVKFSVWK